jgi:hypothetical protein
MRSELDEEFIKLFAKLPERVQKRGAIALHLNP